MSSVLKNSALREPQDGMNEDHSRVRKDKPPQNFAVLRDIALNLPKQEHTVKAGIKAKRLKCGWDAEYLLKVLAG